MMFSSTVRKKSYFALAVYSLDQILPVIAQTSSVYKPFNDRQSNITCWGDYSGKTDIALSDTLDFPAISIIGTDRPPRPPERPLAEYCVKSLALLSCGYDRDPNALFFGHVGLIQDDGTVRGTVIRGPQSPDVAQLHPSVLACYTKCACTGQDPRRSRPRPANVNATWEYNFDRQKLSTVAIGAPANNRPALHVQGVGFRPGDHGSGHSRDNDNLNFLLPPPNYNAGPTINVAYTGAAQNRPTCDTTIKVQDVFNTDLYQWASQSLDTSIEYDANSLCAHTLYGGHDKNNMGAICLKKNPGPGSELRLDPIRRAPQFAGEFYPPSLTGWTAINIIEAFCWSSCYCPGEDEKVRKERNAKWTAIRDKTKDSNTEEYRDLESQIPQMEQSPSTSTFKSQQCQIDPGNFQCKTCDTKKSCNANSDCGSGCTCGVKPGQKLQSFLNALAPLALACATLISPTTGGKVKRQEISMSASDTGVEQQRVGVGNSSRVDARLEQGQQFCACNVTYVSEGCCTLDKGDGLIWEAPGLNILVLNRTVVEAA